MGERLTILGVALRRSGPEPHDEFWSAEVRAGTLLIYRHKRDGWCWELAALNGDPFIRSKLPDAHSFGDAHGQLEEILSGFVAIGRAQGLREAAGICEQLRSAPNWTHDTAAEIEAAAYGCEQCGIEITAAAEKAERGE